MRELRPVISATSYPACLDVAGQSPDLLLAIIPERPHCVSLNLSHNKRIMFRMMPSRYEDTS